MATEAAEAVTPAGWSRKLRHFVLLGLLPCGLYLAIALAGQHWAHAAAAGFGTYPDEASHYISGLMVHDYVLSGMKQSPIAYASNYYLHLPMMGIGHWPPGFYLLEAVWMLAVGISRADVLILMALLTALAAFTLYRATLAEIGPLGALCTGGWLLIVPTVRWSTNLVMTDVFTGLAIFWAALAFGRFLDTERSIDAVYFGLLAALALLTKPAAGCLAFVPPLAIALTGKYRLLKRPALWGSGAIVLATCLPWYLMVGHLTFYGASEISLAENVRRTLPKFFLESVRQLSFLAALFLVGVFARLRRRGPVSGVAAVLIVLPAGVLGVSLLARVDFEPRFLIPAILPILAVAGYGAAWMATRLPIRSVRKPWLVGAACAICTIAYAGASKTPSPLVFAGDGIDELVTRLLQVSEGPETAILIAGPTGGADGRMIASIAERLPARPRETLLRATKILAQSDWNGTNYFCRFTRPEQVIEELDSDGVSLIALDESSKWPSRWPHENLLIATIDKYPERLQPVYSSSDSAYRLYRFSPAHQPRIPEVLLQDLKRKLGYSPF